MIATSTRRGLPFFLLSLLAPLLLLAPGASQAATCDGFYTSGFKLAEGKLNPAVPSLSKPAKGTRIQEPNFKTCLFRATDHRTEPSSYYLRNDYSRRQAFNADNTYFLAYSNDGSWRLYDANTLKQLRVLAPGGDAEPQWHPTDPNTLYYLPTTGGTKLMKLDVRNNQSSTVVDFVGKLPSWADSAKHIWTRSEGAPSANGRYWGFLVYDNSWNMLGYIVWDLQQNKLVGSRQASGGVDNGSVSASGRWFVVSADNGVWAWSADFSRKILIDSLGGVHSDLGLLPNGDDFFASADYQSDGGDVYFVNLDTCPTVPASATSASRCPRTVLFSMYPTGAWATLHFSAKAFDKPGWLLLSTYDSQSNRGSVPWFENKVMAIEVKASPKIYPLAFTRRVKSAEENGQTGADAYWTEPHGTVNRDFTRISFNSNWGNSTGADVDIYTIQLPASALGGGTTPPPPTRVPSTGGNLPPEQKGGNSVAASKPVASLPASFGNVETVSIGCVLCAHLHQARSTVSAFADYMWRHAKPLLRSAANVLDFGSGADATPARTVDAARTGAATAVRHEEPASTPIAADTPKAAAEATRAAAPATVVASTCDAKERAVGSSSSAHAPANDECSARIATAP
jgi:hypothetical protein